jgi:hypothetical protein
MITALYFTGKPCNESIFPLSGLARIVGRGPGLSWSAYSTFSIVYEIIFQNTFHFSFIRPTTFSLEQEKEKKFYDDVVF